MSIQIYINELSNKLLYRYQHLDRFTDNIFIPKTSVFPFSFKNNPIIFYENKADTYELCDILNSTNKNYQDLILLLLQCSEHEPNIKLLDLKFQ